MNQSGKYIVIEGNIGAGKTTLAGMLAAEWNARLVLEQFSDNPFLPGFYADPPSMRSRLNYRSSPNATSK